MDTTIEQQIINECLNLDDLKSFRLLAPAGSGKTYAIKEILNGFYKGKGAELLRQRKQIAVITYTNLASNEIIDRVGESSLFWVSTIHSFIWELIKHYPKYIKYIMEQEYERKIQEAKDKIANPRTRNKALYTYQLEQNTHKKDRLSAIKKFVYSPTGENNNYNSLNHSDVLTIGEQLLSREELGCLMFRRILISRFPILFIDECQDTRKNLMSAFLYVSDKNKGSFCLGIFGDEMQRIYMDGLEKINNVNLEKSYNKSDNFRSNHRIVSLINKIRNNADTIEQSPISQQIGCVRAFVTDNNEDRIDFENSVRHDMNDLLGTTEWENDGGIKILVLEHLMAARRYKFEAFYQSLKQNESVLSQIQDGRSMELNLIIEKIMTIYSLYQDSNLLQLKKKVLEMNNLVSDGEIHFEQFKVLQKGVDDFCSKYVITDSCIDILRLAKNCFPKIALPDTLSYLLGLSDEEYNTFTPEDDLDEDEKSFYNKVFCWRDILKSSLLEAYNCYNYMQQNTLYATHQGVKGAGYKNVMAVFDDTNANGNQFSYEKLFEVKQLSNTDNRNIEEGKDNSLSRTLRLFYVVCSRAIENLALVIYSEDKEKVKTQLMEKFGLNESEIEMN